MISGIMPLSTVGHKILLYFCEVHPLSLMACLDSVCLDFICRQKFGGTTLAYFVMRQFPIISAEIFDFPTPWQSAVTLADWLKPHILELTYTSEDMRPFAEDLGYKGPPFKWDDERRTQLRAELYAAFFYLYLSANPGGIWQKCENETEEEYSKLVEAFPTPRDAVEYIMDSFPITREKDMKKHGHYRTRDLILQYYDLLAGHGLYSQKGDEKQG